MDVAHGTSVAASIRRRVLDLGLAAGRNGAHLGSGMSIVEILTVLYGEVLDLAKIRAESPDRDRFLLSKGHAAVALYAALEIHGLLTGDQTQTFESNGTSYYAHAHRDVPTGIEFSGGSLSLGLSYGVGVALASRRSHRNNRVIVLVGDGECDEGLVWESAMSAANFKLDNLTVIIDRNGMQSDGRKSEIMNHFSLSEKFAAFGFHVVEVDGHDIAALSTALAARAEGKPSAVIANTVKGKGVAFMENNPDWHHGVLSEKLFEQALSDVQAG